MLLNSTIGAKEINPCFVIFKNFSHNNKNIMSPSAFLTPSSAQFISRSASSSYRPAISRRQMSTATVTRMSVQPSKPQKLPFLRVALIAAGTLAGSVSDLIPVSKLPFIHPPASEAVVISAREAVPLPALGIKRDDFVSERELRRRKTTQYSEAEEEIMELEEWEVATQWFRDLQMTWAALASVGGIFVLYKGGVMWEKWIQEQEQKDMEEEIELTGTFIDPRAVRKDEDDDGSAKKGGSGKSDDKGPSGSTSDDPEVPPNSSDYPPDGLDSLEKLFGKS